MHWIGWNYEEYMEAPADVVDILRELVSELTEPIAEKTESDQDNEDSALEKVVMSDGRVEKRREVAPGQRILHEMFGPPPRRGVKK